MKQLRIATLLLAGAVGLAACSDDAGSPVAATADGPLASRSADGPASGRYLLISNGNKLPTDLEQQVKAAGGEVASSAPEIGVAVVTSEDPGFTKRAGRIAGVRSVVPDLVVEWIDPAAGREGVEINAIGNPPASGDDDFFFDLQWGQDAIDTPEAWNATGEFGQGVRIAILDSGIDAEHPDIAPNLNTALSTSFVPGEGFNVRPGFFFNHGTHVAGIAAAADNGFGVIGTAPKAEIVAVKVLSEFTGRGSFSSIIAGIVYAANIDSDVINMSLGATFPRDGIYDEDGNKVVNANEIAELVNATSRAITYAYQQGTTVIVSAGNNGRDRNHDGNVINVPADAPHAISIAAYAPEGWALAPFEDDFYVPASYTNFGQSAIALAAPGGDFDFFFANPSLICTVVLTRPCGFFDGVFSTISGGWGWASGTSMAAPHASGVAALIIGQNGGSMKPSRVEAILRKSALKPGKSGKDPFFGHGSVNAFNALTGN